MHRAMQKYKRTLLSFPSYLSSPCTLRATIRLPPNERASHWVRTATQCLCGGSDLHRSRNWPLPRFYEEPGAVGHYDSACDFGPWGGWKKKWLSGTLNTDANIVDLANDPHEKSPHSSEQVRGNYRKSGFSSRPRCRGPRPLAGTGVHRSVRIGSTRRQFCKDCNRLNRFHHISI